MTSLSFVSVIALSVYLASVCDRSADCMFSQCLSVIALISACLDYVYSRSAVCVRQALLVCLVSAYDRRAGSMLSVSERTVCMFSQGLWSLCLHALFL